MIRFLADENFDGRILRGLLLQNSKIDAVRVQDVGLIESDDPAILAWAAQEGRILLTHDVRTVTSFAYERLQQGLAMAGVIEVPRTLALGAAIADLLLIAGASEAIDFDGQVRYLPL
jgi:hypothetical protein